MLSNLSFLLSWECVIWWKSKQPKILSTIWTMVFYVPPSPLLKNTLKYITQSPKFTEHVCELEKSITFQRKSLSFHLLPIIFFLPQWISDFTLDESYMKMLNYYFATEASLSSFFHSPQTYSEHHSMDSQCIWDEIWNFAPRFQSCPFGQPPLTSEELIPRRCS